MIERVVVEYKTVMAASAENLDRMVNELLKRGWQPWGSIGMWHSGGYVQPMVLYGYIRENAYDDAFRLEKPVEVSE